MIQLDTSNRRLLLPNRLTLAAAQTYCALHNNPDRTLAISEKVKDRLGWWQQPWGFAVLVISASSALWLMTTPVLTDLPAHVARFHIQQTVAYSPYLHRYFVHEWRLLPNMGVDLVVAWLAPIMGVLPATRLVVATLPSLFVLGLLRISKEINGQVPWTALFALPLAFAYPFIFGFVNFWMSAAFALLGLSLWLRLTRLDLPGWRAIAMALISPVVLAAHIAGWGILGIVCFGAQFGRALERSEPVGWAFLRSCRDCLPLAWPATFLLFWADAAGGSFGWFNFYSLFTWTVGVLRTKWMAVDIASAAVLFAVPLLPLIFPGRFRWHLQLLIPALLLGIAVLVLPRSMSGSEFASVRLIPVVVALAILAVRPLEPRWPIGEALGLTHFFGRTLLLLFTLGSASAQAERELAGLNHIRPGSRVLAFYISPCDRFWTPRYLVHIPSMATVRRDAMVNDNFATASGQLLSLSAEERAKPSMPNHDARSPKCNRFDTESFDPTFGSIDLRAVDYVWLIDTAGAGPPDNPRLTRIWSKQDSAIYTVRH